MYKYVKKHDKHSCCHNSDKNHLNCSERGYNLITRGLISNLRGLDAEQRGLLIILRGLTPDIRGLAHIIILKLRGLFLK